jgi:hypothetical protein
MRRFTVAAAFLAASATAALAQAGSTNDVTPAERAKAEAALKKAGFTPGAISYAQAGSIFMHATKGGARYYVTVTSDGQVHPSNPIP